MNPSFQPPIHASSSDSHIPQPPRNSTYTPHADSSSRLNVPNSTPLSATTSILAYDRYSSVEHLKNIPALRNQPTMPSPLRQNPWQNQMSMSPVAPDSPLFTEVEGSNDDREEDDDDDNDDQPTSHSTPRHSAFKFKFTDPPERFSVPPTPDGQHICVRCGKLMTHPKSLRKHCAKCTGNDLQFLLPHGTQRIEPPPIQNLRYSPIYNSPNIPASPHTNRLPSTNPTFQHSQQKSHPIQRPPLDIKREHAEEHDILPSDVSVPTDVVGQTYELSDDSFSEDIETTPLPQYDPQKHLCIPHDLTVLDHEDLNLPSLSICISLALKCIICLNCHSGVSLSLLVKHINEHYDYISIPPNLQERLATSYRLVAVEDIVYSSTPIPPVFGLLIEQTPKWFCGQCHRGYSQNQTMHSHQRQQRICAGTTPQQNYQAYAQSVRPSKNNRRFFAVDIHQLSVPLQPDELSRNLRANRPPATDYSKEPMHSPEDQQNLDSFYHRERWMNLVAELTPAEIDEACRAATSEEPWGMNMRKIAVRFLHRIQDFIEDSQAFGLLKLIAEVVKDSQTPHSFATVTEPTQEKYGLCLHRLMFNAIRSMDSSWPRITRAKYPSLTPEQQTTLLNLKNALLDPSLNETQMDKAFLDACLAIFAHERSPQTTTKFFSPVISFVVYSSVTKGGGFKLAGVITQTLAALMYCIRTTMSFRMLEIADQENRTLFAAYEDVKKYLLDRFETPMAYLFNTFRLLSSIRSHESNTEKFTFTTGDFRELSHEGFTMRLSDIKRMHDGQLSKYNDFLLEQLFYGDHTAFENLLPQVSIENLVDNLQNHSPGYTFIDDPANRFDCHSNSYEEWLLSDHCRAQTIGYSFEGKFHWFAHAAYAILKNLETARDILAPALAASAGPMPRASEFARLQLRNGSETSRNFMILYHIPSIVSTQDKSSHRTNKNHFVPHVPTRQWAVRLIQLLVLFRPLEEQLVAQFFPRSTILRYQYNLWPKRKSAMSADEFSSLLGAMTEKYMGVVCKAQLWRGAVTAFSMNMPDARKFEMNKQYYLDIANMHSTDTSVHKYGRNTSDFRGSDFRMTTGCIEVSLAWHRHLDIGQEDPYKMDSDTEPGAIDRNNAQVAPSIDERALAQSLLNRITITLEDLTRETILNAMAEYASLYFPKPPLPLDSSHLRPLSTISIHPSRLQDLRAFLSDPHAQFTCPEQAQLLELMIEGRQSILAILGTGSGKTAVILMHAKLYGIGKITLVVLPLSSLRDDLDRRARELHVPITMWSVSGKHNTSASVVYVAVEHLMFDSFHKYLRTLENEGRLHIIIFDEIHKMLTDAHFREAFGHFRVLHSVSTIIVGLSASIPPQQINAFFHATNTQWNVIRTSTCRKEFKYAVVVVEGGAEQMERQVASDISKRTALYGQNDRAMVFCRSKILAASYAQALGANLYTADTEDKEGAMKAWVAASSETGKIMVCTSILGCGLDYPSVRDVIHIEVAHSMLDQYQEDSRGGRDGKPCCVTTYIRKNHSPPPGDGIGVKELIAWSTTKNQCLRIIPSLFLDGVATQCLSLIGAQLCTYCLAQLSAPPPPQVRLLPVAPALNADVANGTSDLPPVLESSRRTPLLQSAVPRPIKTPSFHDARPWSASPPSFGAATSPLGDPLPTYHSSDSHAPFRADWSLASIEEPAFPSTPASHPYQHTASKKKRQQASKTAIEIAPPPTTPHAPPLPQKRKVQQELTNVKRRRQDSSSSRHEAHGVSIQPNQGMRKVQFAREGSGSRAPRIVSRDARTGEVLHSLSPHRTQPIYESPRTSTPRARSSRRHDSSVTIAPSSPQFSSQSSIAHHASYSSSPVTRPRSHCRAYL